MGEKYKNDDPNSEEELWIPIREGHMLGLRDEYTVANDTRYHTGDLDSVMNFGETVRERHYAPFTQWLTT